MTRVKSHINSSIAVLLGMAMLFSCQTDPQQMEVLSKEVFEPTVESSGVEWLYTKNGDLSFKIESPHMLRFDGKDPYIEFPEGLNLYTYNVAGEQEAFLRADYAINHLNEQVMEAKGDVLLRNAEGKQLETEYLVLDEETERIHTDAFVKITKGTQVIMGEGLESDLNFTEYTLKKTRGIINLEYAQ